jgi:putative ABC transport system substrate-binding protein
MRRREFIGLLAGAAAACPLAARAQQRAKTPRLGLLMPVSAEVAAPNIDALRQGLRELGYVEDQNIAIEPRYAEGERDPLRDLAAELVRLRVDVMVTWGTPAALAAKRATSTIPIVMASATDPVASGLVASLARPGGNVTGVTTGDWELSKKSLQLLKELAPRVKRVAALSYPTGPNVPRMRAMLQAAAAELNVQLQFLEVGDHKEWGRMKGEFESGLAAMARERPDAIFVSHGPTFFQHRNRIVDLVARNQLPAVYERREYAEAGGLMSYGVDFHGNFRRVASFVDKILKGVSPADLPVEDPTKFDLVINLKTATALGLTIPQSILLRADEVIE